MNLNSKLISIGSHHLQINHLLIIFILCTSFSISFLLRILPADFGWELNEFDPFFNYRATDYLVTNGIEKYLSWNDDLSWYPSGRNISTDSQVMLHVFGGFFYGIFSNYTSLYDFTLVFPIVVGSLSSIIIFGVVRTIGGTTSGLFASLLFSVSIPILLRGQLGWYKSEPLGLFLGLLATYLFLTGIKNKNYFHSLLRVIPSGILFTLALSAWGGNLFFLIPLGILFCFLPFVRKETNFILITISVFCASLSLSSLLFERLGFSFLNSLSGLIIILPTCILITVSLIKKFSIEKNKKRNGLITILIIFIISILIFLLNDNLEIISFPTFRYLNSVFPLLTTTNPLNDSVSEHQTLSIFQSFEFHTVWMIFSGIGVWFLFSNKDKKFSISHDFKIYSLSFILFGAYIGSAYMRLEVFTSIGIIIGASLGLKTLLALFKNRQIPKNKLINYSLFSVILILLIIPMFLPFSSNVVNIASSIPPTIKNGATSFSISTNDWRETLEWVKLNTPEDSVIASWWDYGYWIQTLSERATLLDNSTLLEHRIKNIAMIFFETPDHAWQYLDQLGADYFITFVAAQRLPLQTENSDFLYVLGGGGDESKKYWFGKIAQIDLNKFILDDKLTGTPLFENETFLGKIIPFKLLGYLDFDTGIVYPDYSPSLIPVHIKNNNFLDKNSPFKLVYSSSSYESSESDQIIGVFVYELNNDYLLKNDSELKPLLGIDLTPDREDECFALYGKNREWIEETKTCIEK